MARHEESPGEGGGMSFREDMTAKDYTLSAVLIAVFASSILAAVIQQARLDEVECAVTCECECPDQASTITVPDNLVTGTRPCDFGTVVEAPCDEDHIGDQCYYYATDTYYKCSGGWSER